MKTLFKIRDAFALFIIIFTNINAQYYNKPLTIQALNHTTSASAISRSMGDLSLASKNDVSIMFSNPAALQTIHGIQFSFGGLLEYKKNEQIQRWYSLDWLSMFDLFMEGKTADIRDPVINTNKVTVPTYQDSVQRNGRNPNWTHSHNQFVPSFILAAAPFKISNMKFTIGVGFVEYANVNYFYANRTAFNRNLDYITLPISVDPNPEVAYWWADTRLREGSIYGYGGALSATVLENLIVGLSGLYISGTVNDTESREGFGKLEFFSKDFRFTEDTYFVSWKSESNITGFEMTFSSIYRIKNLMLGFSFKLPTKITREFTTEGDSVKGPSNIKLPSKRGSDNITLPLRGSFGIGLSLRSNIFISGEYKYLPYNLAEYTDENGKTTKPWLNCSSYHLGLEYLPMDFLAVRLGYQIKSEVFEQQGNHLPGQSVSYNVYSIGLGINIIDNLQINLGYEYIDMHYEDLWFLNTNINKEKKNTIFGNILFTLK